MNLALNHPAWQIQTYSQNGHNFSASYAVDGDTNTNAYRNGAACAATDYPVPYAWWAVDLGYSRQVVAVNFTNVNTTGKQQCIMNVSCMSVLQLAGSDVTLVKK